MKNTVMLLLLLVYAKCDNDYFSKRDLLIRAEMYNTLGGNITLTQKEKTVNNCLMQHKFQEIDYGFDNPQYFNFSHHYFDYKNKMRESKVYKIIQRMPKGAALHLHDMGIMGPDYIVNITYMPNLYVCFSEDTPIFKFSDSLPIQNCESWQLMSQARWKAKNVTEFDYGLRKHFTLVVDNTDVAYPSVTETWTKFSNYFRSVHPLLTYRPVWEQCFYDIMKKFREDNIMYIEVRTALSSLYELNGTIHHQRLRAKSFETIIQRFVKDYPDFIGAKIIIASSWYNNKTVINDYIQLARQIKVDTPDIFAGFDLVGQEDIKVPLMNFVPLFLEASDIDYFFHAGETDWYGTRSDENLFDAILLGTKRIGHGYALAKHPLLMKKVIENNIGVEVSVISNVVLSLVKDIRNHPLSILLANGLPVVLSSDDPGAWEAAPLSDDFYVAFVGASSKHSDLGLLKTLALNSLKYSALDPAKKNECMRKFNMLWNRFVDEFDCSLY